MSGSTDSAPIPWFQLQFGEGTLALLQEVIDTEYVNDGPKAREFERILAEAVGTRFALATTSGTAAIALALMAVGVGPGDEVIVPDLTFIGTATAVRLAGATPVLADVDPENLNLSADSVRERLSPRTRAIVPVHLNGRGADVSSIRAAVGTDIAIVEDAAESLGSRSRQGALGALGNISATSFAPTKILTTGQGGMLFTDDEEIHRRAMRLKDQGRDARDTMIHPVLGFNFKFSDILAAVGIPQALDLARRLERQVAMHRRYVDALADLPGLEFPAFDLDAGEVPVWTDCLTDRRDELVAHLESRGISPRPFWPPLHANPPFADETGFPVATSLCARGLWLPGGPAITDEQIDRVIEAVRAFDW